MRRGVGARDGGCARLMRGRRIDVDSASPIARPPPSGRVFRRAFGGGESRERASRFCQLALRVALRSARRPVNRASPARPRAHAPPLEAASARATSSCTLRSVARFCSRCGPSDHCRALRFGASRVARSARLARPRVPVERLLCFSRSALTIPRCTFRFDRLRAVAVKPARRSASIWPRAVARRRRCGRLSRTRAGRAPLSSEVPYQDEARHLEGRQARVATHGGHRARARAARRGTVCALRLLGGRLTPGVYSHSGPEALIVFVGGLERDIGDRPDNASLPHAPPPLGPREARGVDRCAAGDL